MQQWRKIYTNLFDNDELGVMGFLVRYLYIGTIVFSDDMGRFKANPKWLRAKIFPYDDITEQQISSFLQKLAEKNKIKLYEVEGELYGQHIKWLKYNKPRKDRKQATIPPPPRSTDGQPDDNQASTNGQPLVALEEKRREEKREDKNIILHSDAVAGKEINDLIYLFKEVNPSYEQLFKNKTQRSCLERLLKKWGLEKLTEMIKALPQIISKKYAPRITNPYLLETKLGELVAFIQQEQDKKPKIAIIN